MIYVAYFATTHVNLANCKLLMYCSFVGADYRLRVPAAGQAGAPPPWGPREAPQGDCPQEGRRPGRGSLQVSDAKWKGGCVPKPLRFHTYKRDHVEGGGCRTR